MRRILSLGLGLILSTFIGCNGGGGGSSSAATTPSEIPKATLPPPNESGVKLAPNDIQLTTTTNSNGIVVVNPDIGSTIETITLQGQSD